MFKIIKDIFNFVTLSCGTSKESYYRLNKIISEHPNKNKIMGILFPAKSIAMA